MSAQKALQGSETEMTKSMDGTRECNVPSHDLIDLPSISTVRGYKFNHLAIKSSTAVAGKAGLTLASAATALVEFMPKCSNLCPPTVITQYAITKSKLKKMT